MCSIHCSFLGLREIHKGFICLDINIGNIYVFCHVIFHEFDFPFTFSSLSSHSQFTLLHSTLVFPSDSSCVKSVASHLFPNPSSVSIIPSSIDNLPNYQLLQLYYILLLAIITLCLDVSKLVILNPSYFWLILLPLLYHLLIRKLTIFLSGKMLCTMSFMLF